MDAPHETQSLGSGKGWIVAIGASAGGLEALTLFVEALPKDFQGTIVVAQHLAPHAKSMLVDLLTRKSPLEVIQAENDSPLKPNVIYIAPPNYDIYIEPTSIRLEVAGEKTRPKPSINTFFSSVAKHCGPKSIGIILSGTGTDGSKGIKYIRAAGGLTIAQSDRTAKYDGMPRSAIDTGDIDLILAPDEIAQSLVKLIHETELGSRMKNKAFPEDLLADLFKLIKSRSGTDFSRYKLGTIQRRLSKRMSQLGVQNLSEYHQILKNDATEMNALTQKLLVSVTSFFRDRNSYEALHEYLENLVKDHDGHSEIRAWVAGCATGEEAYSIGMLLLHLKEIHKNRASVKVFATDLDQNAILEARSGIYSKADIENVPSHFRKDYFVQFDHESYEVIKQLRDIVVFARQDLIQNPPFLNLDLISCRNVLIYFEPDVQTRLIETFHYALKPSRFLFLGSSESTQAATGLFQAVNKKAKLFQKTNVPSRTKHLAGRNVLSHREAPRPKQVYAGPSLMELAANTLFTEYELSGTIIDENGTIIQILGDVQPFMTFSPGLTDLRLPSLLQKDAATELTLLTRQATKTGLLQKSASYRTESGRGKVSYRIAVRPVPTGAGKDGGPLFLVNFEKIKKRRRASQQYNLQDKEMHVSELEQELQVTRQHLQTVIEELGVNNEELQALNEELSSTNEELQASNEELETTNEELQSSNEELTTVNEELAHKSSELRQLSTYLENIQESIGFPLIVVNQDLKIEKFNADCRKIFNINSSDLGRPILQIETKVDIPGFETGVRAALTSGEATEQICEVQDSYFQMRILPSFDSRKKLVGALIIFFDNTELIRTKNRLAYSEQMIASIINGSSSLISLKNPEGQYILANEAFCKFFGWEMKNVLGKTDRELFPIEVASKWREADLDIIFKGEPTRVEEAVALNGNGRRHLLTSRFPVTSPTDSTPQAVGVIAADITERIEAEVALESSEQRYRAIVEDQAVMVCRHMPDGRITYANSTFQTYYSTGDENPEGRSFFKLISGGDGSSVEEKISVISVDYPVAQHELPSDDYKKGELRWVRWIHRGIFDSDGKLSEYQAVGFDVTVLRAVSEELTQKEAIFAGIFDNTADIITVYHYDETNDDFVLESLNRSAAKSRSHVISQLIGQKLSEMVDPDHRDQTLRRYKNVISSQSPDVFEETLPLPSGPKWFLTTLVPIPDDSRKTMQVAALSRDVSEYKRLEADLRRAKEEAEVASKAKSDFLASMSHELRTPLNVVIGLSQLLAESSLSKEKLQFAESIHRSGKVLLGLIEDVLDISKIEAGKVRLEAVPFNVREKTMEVVGLFKHQAQQKNIRLETEFLGTDEHLVLGDPGRLQQILTNLLGNAIKFTDKGNVTVKVQCSGSPAVDRCIYKIEVQDTGIGIPEKDQARIFQKFSQVDSGNSRKYGGTGLGLMISRSLAELMGGDMGFSSRAQKGSTFWFTIQLPIAPSFLASSGSDDEIEPVALPERPLKILAVDDSSDSGKVIEVVLKKLGHQPTLATGGREALDLLQSKEFDMILMDVQMPEVDGYEATRLIRSLDTEARSIPIVALTANAMPGDAKRCLEAGMDDYLTKPIERTQLQKALNRWSSRASERKKNTVRK